MALGTCRAPPPSHLLSPHALLHPGSPSAPDSGPLWDPSCSLDSQARAQTLLHFLMGMSCSAPPEKVQPSPRDWLGIDAILPSLHFCLFPLSLPSRPCPHLLQFKNQRPPCTSLLPSVSAHRRGALDCVRDKAETSATGGFRWRSEARSRP